jgi:signal transduction histidine kinase
VSQSSEALQQRIETLEARLAAANRELQSLAYAISHDMRAPLRSIAGFSQVLQEEARASLHEEHRHYLDRIQDSTTKLSRMIEAMLELSRAGSADLQRRTVNVTETAQAIAATLTDKPDALGIDIQPDIEVQADARALEIMLRHLLHNAVKATAKRTAPHIRLEHELRPQSDVLCVADNGVGFDPRFAEKLFAPFQRLHADPALSGVGIGLALVQRLAGRHDGRVWAEAQPDGGARFFIELPRTQAP